MKFITTCPPGDDLDSCELGPFYWLVTNKTGQLEAIPLMPLGIDNHVKALDIAEENSAVAVVLLYHQPEDPPLTAEAKAHTVLEAVEKVLAQD